MLTGFLPYYIPRSKINMKIFENKVKYPPDLNPIAINFINDLLNLDPNKRLGSGENGFNNIKSHEYFKDINGDKYLKKEIKPPFVPELKDDIDFKYFEKNLLRHLLIVIDLHYIKELENIRLIKDLLL